MTGGSSGDDRDLISAAKTSPLHLPFLDVSLLKQMRLVLTWTSLFLYAFWLCGPSRHQTYFLVFSTSLFPSLGPRWVLAAGMPGPSAGPAEARRVTSPLCASMSPSAPSAGRASPFSVFPHIRLGCSCTFSLWYEFWDSFVRLCLQLTLAAGPSHALRPGRVVTFVLKVWPRCDMLPCILIVFSADSLGLSR